MPPGSRQFIFLANFFLVGAVSVDDNIHYSINYGSLKDEELIGLSSLQDDDLVLFTKNAEQYVCNVPEVKTQEANSLENYKGRTPWELIATLKERQLCSHSGDTYWIYQLCHGRHMLQFHEDKVNKKRTEYLLGNFQHNYVTLKWDPSKRETIKYENEKLPYLPVLYSQGTACDLTGQPRTTRVLYVCFKGVSHHIASVTEISTCTYQVLVLTNLLCEHPAFVKHHAVAHPIQCTLNQIREDPNPTLFFSLEKQQKKTFHSQYAREAGGPADAPLSIKDKAHQDVFESLYDEMDARKRLQDKAKQMVEEGRDVHASLVYTTEKILAGEECIAGGIGWWKYELCFGVNVTQFHEEVEGGPRSTILLGTFDKAVHRAWIEENEGKRPHKQHDGKVGQTRHFYSNGDICDTTGAPRSVEVRLRCPIGGRAPAFAISTSLIEPTECEYILTVEGERFCPFLQSIDNYGLLELD